jgi:hypothetical protein
VISEADKGLIELFNLAYEYYSSNIYPLCTTVLSGGAREAALVDLNKLHSDKAITKTALSNILNGNVNNRSVPTKSQTHRHVMKAWAQQWCKIAAAQVLHQKEATTRAFATAASHSSRPPTVSQPPPTSATVESRKRNHSEISGVKLENVGEPNPAPTRKRSQRTVTIDLCSDGDYD